MPRFPHRSSRGPRPVGPPTGQGRDAGPSLVRPGDEPGLLADVRRTLRASHPLDLLAFASTLLAVTDPRERDPLAPPGDETRSGPDRQELIESFLAVRRPETSALLTAIAELLDDEVTARRIQREVSDRGHKPPRWLRRLTPIRVTRAIEMVHILGDGDNIMLDVATGTDHHLAVLVYIDHNVGTLVKDAFVIPEDLAALSGRFQELTSNEPDTRFSDLALADARARITEAIELGAITYPPFASDTWPACRPLVEWVVRQLPTRGTGYVRVEWNGQEREALIDAFRASTPLADADPEALGDLASVFIWFACDYGPGDPLRWSPVAVELLLTDFLAHKAILPASTMRLGPDALRAFIRFAHERQGIRPALTEDTLAAVDRYAMAYLAQLDQYGHDDAPPMPTAAWMRGLLVEQVGSEEQLDALTTDPLAEEALDVSGLAEDIRERVRTTAGLVDRCCEELLDLEHRTAARRLVVDVASEDPQIFRRRSRDETAAAAIAWIVAKANGSLDPAIGGVTAKALLAWFGVSGSVSQRAAPMLRAIGVPERPDTGIRLGSTRYLVAEERARLIELRERYC